jgi:hypothetical protein
MFDYSILDYHKIVDRKGNNYLICFHKRTPCVPPFKNIEAMNQYRLITIMSKVMARKWKFAYPREIAEELVNEMMKPIDPSRQLLGKELTGVKYEGYSPLYLNLE